jgi:pyruvate kinase
MRTTKIVATLGPSTDDPHILRKLLLAGVDVFRVNASHGTQQDQAIRIHAVRTAAESLGIYAGVLLDLQGPKIRLGTFNGGGCVLAAGKRFTITVEPGVVGTCDRASTSYVDFAHDVRAGDPVLIADGSVRLRVLDSDGVSARCEVISGGPIADRKGINLPGVALSTPSMTKKDMSDLAFGLEIGIDLVALSFVRKAQDVLRLRVFLEERDVKIPIIAKIEKPEGVQNLTSILEEADGVMVARGDLGVEMPIEKVPFIQKSIIRQARMHGKFVITATQMLESMIENPFPTRAEVSDVANAIYDGTDAVMLSAETSVGKHPEATVDMMARIAIEAENSIRSRGFEEPPSMHRKSHADILADAAYHAARSASAQAIVVFTRTGASARMVSRYRPPVPIYAFTSSEAVARQMSVVFGIRPVIAPDVQSTDEMLGQVEDMLIECGWLKAQDVVVFVAGQPIGWPGSTNMMKLHKLGAGK